MFISFPVIPNERGEPENTREHSSLLQKTPHPFHRASLLTKPNIPTTANVSEHCSTYDACLFFK